LYESFIQGTELFIRIYSYKERSYSYTRKWVLHIQRNELFIYTRKWVIHMDFSYKKRFFDTRK
jgi:hypothetical protein